MKYLVNRQEGQRLKLHVAYS